MAGDGSHDEGNAGWDWAMLAALGHAVEHLQIVILEEGLDALTETQGSEAALRESVLRYEEGLAHLFGMLRACGLLRDSVAWSTLKSEQRRAALEAGLEITLRTALESGMYAAESIPLGDHGQYRVWATTLTGWLAERARATGGAPSAGPEQERLLWAYETLADLEEHAAFHRAFVEAAGTLGEEDGMTAAGHQERLLALPRFDLVLNAALLWLASHGGEGGGCP